MYPFAIALATALLYPYLSRNADSWLTRALAFWLPVPLIVVASGLAVALLIDRQSLPHDNMFTWVRVWAALWATQALAAVTWAFASSHAKAALWEVVIFRIAAVLWTILVCAGLVVTRVMLLPFVVSAGVIATTWVRHRKR